MSEPGSVSEAGRRVPWTPLEAVLVWFVAIIAAILAIAILALFASGDALFTATIIALETTLAGTVLVWIRARHGMRLRDLGLRAPTAADVRAGVGGALSGLLLAQFVVGPVVLWVARLLQDSSVDFPDQLELRSPGVGILIATGIAVIVFAPVAEEIFFRGHLYPAFRNKMSVAGAAVSSSVLFALVHFEPLIMPSIFVLGLVIARIRERSGTLAPCIVTHALFNAFGYAVFLVTR